MHKAEPLGDLPEVGASGEYGAVCQGGDVEPIGGNTLRRQLMGRSTICSRVGSPVRKRPRILTAERYSATMLILPTTRVFTCTDVENFDRSVDNKPFD